MRKVGHDQSKRPVADGSWRRGCADAGRLGNLATGPGGAEGNDDGNAGECGGGAYREQPLDPPVTALLSVDVQNMECGGPTRERLRKPMPDHVPQLEEVMIPNHRRLLSAARAAERLVADLQAGH